MFIPMLSAVDYSVFKSRDYSGANPLFPQQQLTKSAVKTPPSPPTDANTRKVSAYKSRAEKYKNPTNDLKGFSADESLRRVLIWQMFVFQRMFRSHHWTCWTAQRSHFQCFCNFRCSGHSWRWQGWPKRRAWGGGSTWRPWSIWSQGTLRVSWTL